MAEKSSQRGAAPGAGLDYIARVETFLAAFVLFAVAMGAMAVGLWVGGKRLSGSCGGRDADGRPLADCLCEREKRDVCAERGGSELLQPELPAQRSEKAASEPA